MNAIDVSNMWFGYDKEPILHDVSFSVPKGNFYAIIGPNGGGKSTLLKLLLGLLQPWEGSIFIDGKSPPAESIAYVPQTFAFDKLFPITALEVVLGGCMEQLSLLGQFRKKALDRARQTLERVGALAYESSLFGELSGGLAQRVLMARALVSNPTILLLDEPTSCADQTAESELLSLISTLQGTVTILMVSHHIDAIAPMAQGVVCVHKNVSCVRPDAICEHVSMGLYHQD